MKMYTEYPLLQRVREEKTFRTPKNLFLKILIFLGVFFVVSFAEGFGSVLFIMPALMSWAMGKADPETGQLQISDEEMNAKVNSLMEDPSMTAIMLYATVLGTLVVLLFCRFVEGRKFRTMGFRAKHAAGQYLGGLVSGFVMFSAVIGLAFLGGGLQWNGFQSAPTVGLLLIFIGYVIQGMSEEVIFRGYLMTTTMRHQAVWVAILVNALGFGLAHCANTGYSLLAQVNLMLYAIMISLYILRTDNLWGACAIHSVWNFAQGNFYGLPASGIDSGDSIFSMSLAGSDLVNGGAFGLEAGLPTTIVMLVSITLLLFLPNPFAKKKTDGPQPESQPE